MKKKLLIAISVFTIIIITGFIYIYINLKKVKTIPMPTSNKELGIKNSTDIVENNLDYKSYLRGYYSESKYFNRQVQKQVTNIALFGVDRRNADEASRSDCIMILTIDEANKKIKLSSIMRDTYVNVNGHGMTKITHAYAYGGPVLAVRTLNENFGLNIKDFIVVDFFQLEKLIDILGGVNVDIKQDEIQYINSYISEISEIEKKDPVLISNPGFKNMNGTQAVAYCRVRYTSGDDYKRTERQRDVLQSIIEKLFKADVKDYPKIISNFLPYVETSLSSSRILELGISMYYSGMHNIEKQRFPLDSDSKGQTIDGIWYLVTDLKATAYKLNKFIYEGVR